jgi:DNA-3-methyladenine glycosylase
VTNGAAPSARRPWQGEALPRSFYQRDTEIVARDLLGAILLSRIGGATTAGRIVETEAYVGEHDLACHAAAGLTARTAPLYGEPGLAYVYFIYGVHWCFNAVTRPVNQPSAVLVRALEPIEGLAVMRRRRVAARRDFDLTNGPGKLCQALGVTGQQNGHPLQEPPLQILAGDTVPDSEVSITPRIGITRSVDWPLRWVIAASPYLSRRPRPPA